ncbi:helix-turn-helix transcriptional regulator [Candidatus Halocynthiibacter alkanivorans]|uniref:helix-turn-helix transcriptional regulator n=1 Tax=Candidatus Halocynthiibacter alkanivorans TaxID=2267619 RepID=UPI000DF31881|nr:YafY family protein [Candidatus Halocynthiibacter alkanivorans]
MRRTERLFQIIQILRANRSPVTGRSLAVELEISLRTLYRDMAELMAQRVPITGEAGTGYVLDDGYDMPPLMLTADELEAAALGAAWVATQADPSLTRAARDLVAKLSAAIPQELRPIVLDAGSRSISTRSKIQDPFDGGALRRAIRERSKLQLAYKDQNEKVTNRVVWPLFIAYLDRDRFIVAWCETRKDYRHFRTDRVQELEVLEEKYPTRRTTLVKGWEEAMAKRH